MRERFNHNWEDFAHSIGYGSEREMLEDLYLTQGQSLSQIAQRLQCGTHTVNRHLDQLKITKRNRGGCNSNNNQSRKLFMLDQRVIMLRPLLQIAKLIGVSSSLLYKYRRQAQRLQEDEVWSSASSPQSQVSNDTAL